MHVLRVVWIILTKIFLQMMDMLFYAVTCLTLTSFVLFSFFDVFSVVDFSWSINIYIISIIFIVNRFTWGLNQIILWMLQNI